MLNVQSFKKYLLGVLESTKKLGNLVNSKAGEKVLIVGDGVSAAYAKDKFKEYDYIIVCNNAHQNIKLQGCNVIFHLIMEPDLLIPWRHVELRNFFRESLNFFPKAQIVLNPFGRIFSFLTSGYKNPVYLSPFKKLTLNDSKVYSDFTAAFQASIGMAILCGFKEIHCIGFDAWLLSPKNNLRWYSNNEDPDSMDVEVAVKAEPFLVDACGVAKIKVFTYRHYSSRFQFIESIPLDISGGLYIPARDKKDLMRKDFLSRMIAFEKRHYPNGVLRS